MTGDPDMRQLAQTSFFPPTHKCTVQGSHLKTAWLCSSWKCNPFEGTGWTFQSPFFYSFSLSQLRGRRQETAMFRLTLWRLPLDVWYPNKPLSHWTAERHFSQGVLGEPVVCPPYTNWAELTEKDGERDGRMEVCREEKKKHMSAAHEVALRIHPQRICWNAAPMLHRSCPAQKAC